MASMTEELTLYCYSILMNLNLNSHMWLMATVLDSIALAFKTFQTKRIAM